MFARETVILNSSQSWIRDPFSIPNIELLQEQGYLKAAVFAYVPLSSPSKYWDEEKIQRMYWLYKQKFKKKPDRCAQIHTRRLCANSAGKTGPLCQHLCTRSQYKMNNKRAFSRYRCTRTSQSDVAMVSGVLPWGRWKVLVMDEVGSGCE